MDDDLVFAEEESIVFHDNPWKILVVDDEPGIHEVTKLALSGMRFDGRGIEITSAHSAMEGQKKIADMPDTALILLDVIMEREDSGFQMVQYVRQQLNNQAVRIILRTGQPGDAPERNIILDFDINDYKAKNELTSQKLFSAVVTALRSYRDIMMINLHLHGLEQVIDASAKLFGLQSIEELASVTLSSLHQLLGLNKQGINGSVATAFLTNYQDGKEFILLAGTGEFSVFTGRLAVECIERIVWLDIECSIQNQANSFNDSTIILFFPNKKEVKNIFLLKGYVQADAITQKLLDVFITNASIAFENALMFEQINKAHKTAIQSLVVLSEFNNPDTGQRLRQTELMATGIAERLHRKGYYPEIVNKQFMTQLGMASILYDVGNAGIPEEIFTKRDKLTEDEWKKIQNHVHTGSSVLKDVADHIHGKSYVSLAVEIAAFHHERYNGTGYHGFTGECIPLSARIISVVDTYLALIGTHPHKPSLTHKQAMNTIIQESGKQFDPIIIEAFLDFMLGCHPGNEFS